MNTIKTGLLIDLETEEYEEHNSTLRAIILQQQKLGVNLYQTFTHGKDNTQGVAFLTTHKDTHLGLGLLGELGLWHLGQRLDSMFADGATELLLYKSNKDDKAWLVTRAESADMITFTMSPAH
jgi:hypothetical protein